jgi:predicted dehydrogenase
MVQLAMIGMAKEEGMFRKAIKSTARLKEWPAPIELGEAADMGTAQQAAGELPLILCVSGATGLHAAWVIPALQAGMQVVCEQPLCLTPAAAWQIIETAKYSGGKSVLLFNPLLSYLPFTLLRQQLAAGGTDASFSLAIRLGTSATLDEYPDGGLLYLAAEWIDLVTWLFGSAKAQDIRFLPTAPESSGETGGTASVETARGQGTISWERKGDDSSSASLQIQVNGRELEFSMQQGELRLYLPEQADYRDELAEFLSAPVPLSELYESQFTTVLQALEQPTDSVRDPFGALDTVMLLDNLYKALPR